MSDEQMFIDEKPTPPVAPLVPVALAPGEVLALMKHDHLRGWLASERDRLSVIIAHYAEQTAKIEGELAAFIRARCPGGTLDLTHGVIVPPTPTESGNTQPEQGA